MNDKEEKSHNLKRRRLKLGQMLKEERTSWEVMKITTVTVSPINVFVSVIWLGCTHAKWLIDLLLANVNHSH